MRVHGRGRGEPHLLADLAHRRRVAVPVDVLDEVVPDLLLPVGEHRPSALVVERVFARRVRIPADGVKAPLVGASSGPNSSRTTKPPRGRLASCAGEDLNLHGLSGH